MPTDSQSPDRHFSTEYLRSDLKSRAVRGGKITLITQALRLLLQLGSTAILARMLTPRDFGLVAVVVSVTGFVTLLKDGGLAFPTIQSSSVGHREISTLFWINVALSLALTILLAAIAPSVASFLDEPALLWIVVGVASTMIFSALSTQHQALLSRQMRLLELGAVDLGGFAIAIVTALALALRGLGYWSLVGMMVMQSAATCALLWWRVDWRPGKPSLTDETKSMLRFGGHMAVFNFVSYAARNIDNLFVGWYWGAVLLGLYNQAYRLALAPIRQINDPLTRVVVPTLSRLAREPIPYRRYFLRVVGAIAYVTMPLAALLIVFADYVIRILLGTQWLDAAPILKALALAAVLQPTLNALGWLYITTGRPDRLMRLGVMTSIALIVGFAIALPFGPQAVAWSFSLVMAMFLVPAINHACGGTSVTAADVLRTMLPPAVLSGIFAIVAALSLMCGKAWFEEPAVSVACALGVSGALTIGCALIWPRSRKELTGLVASWSAT